MDSSQHDVVSVSESSTAATKKKDDSNDVMMKKKLKVLKQALKEERDMKVKAEKDLVKAQDEILNLKQQVGDKNKKYQELYKEKMNLEDSLLKDMHKQKTVKEDGLRLERSETIKPKVKPLSTLASPVPSTQESSDKKKGESREPKSSDQVAISPTRLKENEEQL